MALREPEKRIFLGYYSYEASNFGRPYLSPPNSDSGVLGLYEKPFESQIYPYNLMKFELTLCLKMMKYSRPLLVLRVSHCSYETFNFGRP